MHTPTVGPASRRSCRARKAATLAALLVTTLFASPCLGAGEAAAPALENPARRWSAKGPGGTPSFTRHIVPLLNKLGCSNRSCHGSFQGQNGFRLSLFGYDPALDHRELTVDEGEGPRINVRNVDESLALLKPLRQLPHRGGQRLTKGSWQHRMLREWITAGAPYHPEKEAYLGKLEVRPRAVRLARGESVSLRTLARFTTGGTPVPPGSEEEVTPLTTFASNDEGVALVTPDGTVKAAGLGDTSVVVNYGGGVVTCQVIVPRPDSGPFPPFPANNKVDELVATKLRKLGIHPSGLSTDEAFLRRVYLDTVGTLPTADEARAFLADKAPDKRSRLIDKLLARPEHATYWATIFSDWTGNNQGNLNTFFKCVWLWHDWLEEKLARNVPYDEFVGAILTATSREGRSLEEYLKENKAVSAAVAPRSGFDEGTYAKRKTLDLFWLKRTSDRPKELAVRAANTFLGVQIQCAECHKHPFDRWTQADFEGFTSFFRVVDITDLDGSERSGGRYDYDKVALYRGVPKRYRRGVEKTPPKILAGPVVPYKEGGKDPRVTLWEWMRSPDNPYFARNIVNRVWHHYFGVGIVDPVDDLNAANPPSNPELLDWLAEDFVAHRYDLRHLHRTILGSRTYQLSHLPNETNRADRRNFSHALVRRMPAEVALDAIVQATGTSLRFNGYAAPPGTRAIGLAAPLRFGQPEYFLQIFGRPRREQTCACERSNEPALAQALFMINDEDIHTRVSDPKGRLARLLARVPDDRKVIEELYLTCLSRYPRPEEVARVLAHVEKAPTRKEAMQDLLWSLLNVREFLFVR